MGELKSLNKYLFKYKFRLLWGIVFIGLSNWFTIYPAQIIRDAIDIVVENLSTYQLFKNSSLSEEIYKNFASSFVLFAVVLILIAIIKGVFTFFMRYTIIMMSRFIEYDLKNEIYQHYQALDVSFYKNNSTGDIMNRIGDDVSKVRMYLGPSIMYIVNLIVLFVLIIWTMFSINVKLSIYVLAPLPIMSVVIYFVSIKIGAKSEKVQGQLSNVFSHTQEAFSGVRVIKSYNKTNDLIGEFDSEAKQYMDDSMSLVKTESLFHPVILFLPVLSTLLTIYVGGIAVMNNEISFGNIAEFVIYINLLTWPVASLGWVTSLIQRAKASMKRINEFLNTEPVIVNESNEPIKLNGDIEFKDVSFTYPESGTLALRNVNFQVKKGKSLAIVGKTGSGKSTVVQLLSRMYDPNSGEVLFNDKDAKSLNLDELRRQTGTVPQETFLFSDTIGNNIAFGTFGKVSSDRSTQIIEAAKNAVIHDNISQFPEQYDTMVGERGITLSGGQKQRISIARAFLKQPEILILDDCLSAVDMSTEEQILQNIKEVQKGKTNIIISHRISTIKHCDEIIVLDNGTITERGNHAFLVNNKGIYADFYEKQKLSE
ncbi:MAG: ATP-binding cassette subfamily B multidrug efflux pump [Glaciecola sp.]|jgi:ATP-binding cassette subfamily B multidrug efflux pump